MADKTATAFDTANNTSAESAGVWRPSNVLVVGAGNGGKASAADLALQVGYFRVVCTSIHVVAYERSCTPVQMAFYCIKSYMHAQCIAIPSTPGRTRNAV